MRVRLRSRVMFRLTFRFRVRFRATVRLRVTFGCRVRVRFRVRVATFERLVHGQVAGRGHAFGTFGFCHRGFQFEDLHLLWV